MWQMIGVLAELERSLIAERTRAGVKTARARGLKFGRKRKLTPAHVADARKKIAAGQRRDRVAEFYRVSRATLFGHWPRETPQLSAARPERLEAPLTSSPPE